MGSVSTFVDAFLAGRQSTPDPYRAEGQSFEDDKRQEELASQRQLRAQRKLYGKLIIWLPIGWVAAVLILVLLSGLEVAPFGLSDQILMSLIGSMTLSVFRPLFIVTNYLFPNRGEDAGDNSDASR